MLYVVVYGGQIKDDDGNMAGYRASHSRVPAKCGGILPGVEKIRCSCNGPW